MYYTILEHAAQAWVKIEVIDVNVDPTVVEYNARGSIIAKYSHFEHGCDLSIVDNCKTTLWKSSDLEFEGEALENNHTLKMDCSSSLIIEADLWETDTTLRFGKGKVEFIPKYYGFVYIRGDKDFALRVMVHWWYSSTSPVEEDFPCDCEM